METFNFLNKKYSTQHVHNSNIQQLSNSRSSKNSAMQINQYGSRMTNSPQQMKQSTSSQLVANYCTIHTQELLRHMCLDCIQLLCSQCVGDHIILHKQSQSYPNISTLKQVKTQMHIKLQQIMQFMFQQKNHPKSISSDIERIRQQSFQRIETLRKQLIQLVNNWIEQLRNSVMNNVGYQQIKVIKQQMYGLHQQINSLNNSLSQNNISVQALKKSYQIDADRLRNTYKDMVSRYHNLSDTMKLDIQLNDNAFVNVIQSAVTLKIGQKTNKKTIRVDDDNQQQQQQQQQQYQYQQNENKSNQLKLKEQHQQQQQYHQEQQQLLPVLYNLPPGSNILKIQNLVEGQSQIIQSQIEGVKSYPLNSTILLPNNMIMISGGMISEEEKTPLVQIFDYSNGSLVGQYQMKYGRSSHKTVAHQDHIFLIGGFCTQTGEHKFIQAISGDGLQVLPYQCKWGGPNLSIIYNNKLIKFTVSGVQAMNLSTFKWQQLLSDVPFAFNKNMQIQKLNNKIYIFGDGKQYYKWNSKQNNFQELQSSIQLGNINSTTIYNNKIVVMMNNNQDLAQFDGSNWKWKD